MILPQTVEELEEFQRKVISDHELAQKEMRSAKAKGRIAALKAEGVYIPNNLEAIAEFRRRVKAEFVPALLKYVDQINDTSISVMSERVHLIVEMLNNAEVPTFTKAPWTPSSVVSTLKRINKEDGGRESIRVFLKKSAATRPRRPRPTTLELTFVSDSGITGVFATLATRFKDIR